MLPREAGTIQQSAETAAEVRAHSVATAERHYAAHGRRERLLAYTAQYRAVIMVRRPKHNKNLFTNVKPKSTAHKHQDRYHPPVDGRLQN